MDSFSPEVLLALQALLSKELASRGVSSAAAPAKDAKVAKAPKAKEAPGGAKAKEAPGEAKAKRAPGAWAAWTKHTPLVHAEEYAAFKASAVAKQGIAPLFCTQWRKDHPEEYLLFEAAHKASAAEPVASAEPSPASVPTASAPSPAKEKRKWSEEAKANAAAKRAEKKAGASVSFAVAESVAIAASAPAPLPVAPPKAPVPAANPFDEDDAEVELLPFKIGGRTYLRPGSVCEGVDAVWATGDLWESNKGLRGDWAGCLQEDGSIDMDAEEPDFE